MDPLLIITIDFSFNIKYFNWKLGRTLSPNYFIYYIINLQIAFNFSFSSSYNYYPVISARIPIIISTTISTIISTITMVGIIIIVDAGSAKNSHLCHQ